MFDQRVIYNFFISFALVFSYSSFAFLFVVRVEGEHELLPRYVFMVCFNEGPKKGTDIWQKEN